ncbi:MAG: ATP-binding protein, partial [Coprobacillus sp.]|nr:ATP-binding protein [Coprobacillus sp.]
SSESYPVIYTDSERLFQLLSIYMDNAISYSPERSTIELRAVSNEKELIMEAVQIISPKVEEIIALMTSQMKNKAN